MPRGGTQTSLVGMVNTLMAPFRGRGKGAPVSSYAWSQGGGAAGSPRPVTNGDINQFAPVFQPSGGLFAPGYPLVPVDYERTRRYNFPVGINYIYTPRSFEPIGFPELKWLANDDITRLCIETRKDQVEKLGWAIKQRDEDAAKKAGTDKRIQQLTAFWQYPDGITPFATWLRELTDQVLVTDAPAIEPRLNRGGDIIGLDIIDGATIKVLIDDTGRRPRPPAPAFEQIIHGRPWVLLEDGTRTNTEEGEVFNQFTDQQLIYFPRNPRADHLYGFCYTPDMEVLTRRGWLKISAVTLADEVATRNMATKAFEWQRPTHLIAKPHDGPIYRFHSRAVDLQVTPEHRMLVTSLPRALGGGKGDRNGQRGGIAGEAIVSAGDLAAHLNRAIKIPMTSQWQGVEVGEKRFAIAEPRAMVAVLRHYADGTTRPLEYLHHRGGEKPVVISGDDYCALLGAYLAEGNVRAQGGIEISQHPGSMGYVAYSRLAARVLRGPAQHDGRAFVFPRYCLTQHFRQFGLAHEKFVPTEIMDATPRQIRLFWDHFVLGDGCLEARPNKSGRGNRAGQPATRITTTSCRLADQLVELAQKLGWSASVRHRRTAGKAMICGRPANVRDSYVVSVRYSSAMSVRASQSWYSGTVHCVTVPNGIVYVRRNGKPAWCGNSPVEQIVLTINTSIRRGVMQLQHFTVGNIPAGMVNAPDGWTGEQIAQFQDWFDSKLAGNTAERTKLLWGPEGAKYQSIKEPPLKDDYDEWRARVICFAFSLPPTAFTRQVNRATAETAQEAALEEGLAPLMGWVKRLVDHVIQRRMGHPDLEFAWSDIKPIDPTDQANMLVNLTAGGIYTLNEARDQLGMDPVEGGDEVLFKTGTGPVTLDSILNPPEPIMPMLPPPRGAPGQNGQNVQPGGPGKPPTSSTQQGKKPSPPAAANPGQKSPEKSPPATNGKNRQKPPKPEGGAEAGGAGGKPNGKQRAGTKKIADQDGVGKVADDPLRQAAGEPPQHRPAGPDQDPIAEEARALLRRAGAVRGQATGAGAAAGGLGEAVDLPPPWRLISGIVSKAGDTISQDEADYVPHPVDGEACDGCTMFREPDRCTLVRGEISPNGHCRFFEDAAAKTSGHVAPENAEPPELPLAPDVTEADVQHIAWQLIRDAMARGELPKTETRTVPMADLVATQRVVDDKRVEDDAADFRQHGQGDETPFVIERQGKYYILAGHHHAEGALEDGATEMRVQVLTGKPSE